MTFRWISGDELEKITPIIENYGWTPLDPVFSKVLIAEDEYGEIIGFNALQVVLRPEPLWVSPLNRGGEEDMAMQLTSRMAEYLKEVGAPYWEVRAESSYVERLCKAHGMKLIDVPMFAGGV